MPNIYHEMLSRNHVYNMKCNEQKVAACLKYP